MKNLADSEKSDGWHKVGTENHPYKTGSQNGQGDSPGAWGLLTDTTFFLSSPSKTDIQIILNLFPKVKVFLKYRIKLCCHGRIKARVLYRYSSQ